MAKYNQLTPLSFKGLICLLFTGHAKRVKALLDWETVSTKLPWGPVFLLGGGYALAKGFHVSLQFAFINPFNASCSKLLLFEGFSAKLF